MKTALEHPPGKDQETLTYPKLRHQPPRGRSWESMGAVWRRKTSVIALFSVAAIILHLILRFGFRTSPGAFQIPLLAVLVFGGIPLVYELLRKLLKREFGSDLLGGISIITSVLLGEYLAGSIIVLMLAGGEALENYALKSASSVLAALAKRMPLIAHRKCGSEILDVALEEIAVGDALVVYPHEICPVDGVVVEGHGVMDESYLTGEPFQITKTSGSTVISGAINGESALTIQTIKRAGDSRYAKIMEVMRESEERRPQLRRLGDQLGAIYTPVAVGVAIIAWVISGEAIRFLAVLVIATPCPLLIAIPVAIIGSISLCARRAIIVKSPVVLEQIAECRTAIFDKTGTLTYGEPKLTEQIIAPGFEQKEVLTLVASLERYSKHPLASAILELAKQRGLALCPVSQVHEPPGTGLSGTVNGHEVVITGRGKVLPKGLLLPSVEPGLECLVFLDGVFAALFGFEDSPRADSAVFITHLSPHHHVSKVILVSGDREAEVAALAKKIGIRTAYGAKSPEEKVTLVRAETAQAKTIFMGDGINDAPAMQAATVGIAFGHENDITAEAADAVILERSLEKVDELIHIGRRMRKIALQSALGGMALSAAGMLLAAFGFMSPITGAVAQEFIDLFAVLNAVRVTLPFGALRDF